MQNYHEKELAVCGFEAVKALSEHHPEKISRLFFAGSRAKQFGEICRYLAKNRRLYRLVESDNELEKLCGSVHHQGVVAMIEAPVIQKVTPALIKQWSKDRQSILMLDRVGNANNLGALIRSAAFFGIKALVISEDDAQASVTTSAYRIAQGGMEFVQLYTSPSASRFLKDCEGYMIRIGADHRAYRNIQDLPVIVKNNESAAIILGNEEYGLSQGVKKQCDVLVKIPGSGAIESLNVAQAGTLFLSALNITKS